MIGIPCFFLREQTARSSQHARGNDGRDQREVREQVVACTMIEEVHATTEEKMASICQWCGLSRNISDAFAGVPCLTPQGQDASPSRLPTITCLRSHSPPSRFGKARKAVEQESCPAALQGVHGSHPSHRRPVMHPSI